MKKLVFTVFVFLMSNAANAGIPLLNYTCPTNIEIHADQGGPVYVNGKEAQLIKFNDNAYDAKSAELTISITVKANQSVEVSYTGKKGANGVCTPAQSPFPNKQSNSPKTVDHLPENIAIEACLKAVAKTVGVDPIQVSTIDSMTTRVGIAVLVKVPGAEVPWSCLSDANGNVDAVSYTGKEGG